MKRKYYRNTNILIQETQTQILDYFKNNKENQSYKIAIIFNTTTNIVDRIIDKYLNELSAKTDRKK